MPCNEACKNERNNSLEKQFHRWAPSLQLEYMCRVLEMIHHRQCIINSLEAMVNPPVRSEVVVPWAVVAGWATVCVAKVAVALKYVLPKPRNCIHHMQAFSCQDNISEEVKAGFHHTKDTIMHTIRLFIDSSCLVECNEIMLEEQGLDSDEAKLQD